MVFGQFAKSLFTGDLEGAFGWAMVDSKDYEAQQEAKAKQLAELQRRYALGFITPAEYSRLRSQITGELYSEAFHNAQESPLHGAIDEVKENASGVVETVKNPFLAIPTSYYVIAAIALFVWMGGLTLLKGVLKK